MQAFCGVLVFQRGQVLWFTGFRTGGLSLGQTCAISLTVSL